MNILERIVEHKKLELKTLKVSRPIEALHDDPLYSRKCFSLSESLLKEGATGIIAEFKRKSPSKGFINEFADVSSVTADYTSYGASGLSVLTDGEFFGGSTNDLVLARENNVPILRKDFIVDRYQVTAAKAMGADVILLIAACLDKESVRDLAGYAKSLGLEILLELHEVDELDHICAEVDMVGINNRSLKTFEVDINRSLQLSRLIPADKLKIAESGISDPAMIKTFRDAGYHGFLIGENFMKEPDPGKAFAQFVHNMNL
jgi:indole-3-glycerol phosphate synthase